jgi:hypothetical protein
MSLVHLPGLDPGLEEVEDGLGVIMRRCFDEVVALTS